MSEELLQTAPQNIGKYTYLKLGSTSIKQLINSGILPSTKHTQAVATKKPDGIVLYQNAVVAIIEYKQPSKLKSNSDVIKAINQEIDVAKALCNILIVTDGTKSFWINAQNGEMLKNSDKSDLSVIFHPVKVKSTDKLESLFDNLRVSITPSNSVIQGASLIDPSGLAARLWQTIWVATGKSPVKCLYNVVELFIFKFLSDLKILDEDYAFTKVYEKSKVNPEGALDYYAKNTRAEIYKLFPKSSEDGTTIINGTIFVTEKGEANLSQSMLFLKSLEHLHKYAEEFGSLTKIDKQFKTKLYESFLKQEVEALGQYFTPRSVVQSVIRMTGLHEASYQFSGKRICDPFCGVGGFPLEVLNLNESMRNTFTPDGSGKIKPDFILHGFDKGFERDDERTIILAKANMLIYLAELLFENPKCTKEFAKSFNTTFRLFKDNLGTFGHIINNEAAKYDLILSNPPYVTSGSSIIKEELQRNPITKDWYPINSLGLEGISIEWIINSLKQGGRSFVVIPDGILARVNGKKLRDFILKECYLDAIVALPPRTFFSNNELTYILGITKKNKLEGMELPIQKHPVFTYIVSNIGERLTSVKRDEVEDNDLPEMERLFKIFNGAKESTKEILEKESKRCKIQDISVFINSTHWVVDRWWTKDELIQLGIEKFIHQVSKDDLDAKSVEFQEKLEKLEEMSSKKLVECNYKEISLGDSALFELAIGSRVLKKDIQSDDAKVPVYSSNVHKPFGFLDKSNLERFDNPYVLWGIDGNFNFNLIPAGKVFATTDHCGSIRIKTNEILPDYLLYSLKKASVEVSFNRSFRASIANMKTFKVLIPVDEKGNYDLNAQKVIAAHYAELDSALRELKESKDEMVLMFDGYASTLGFLH